MDTETSVWGVVLRRSCTAWGLLVGGSQVLFDASSAIGKENAAYHLLSFEE